jgi:hypothetical protein
MGEYWAKMMAAVAATSGALLLAYIVLESGDDVIS